jgi:L-threonylcarbamoyladenylate synthase
LRGDRHRLARSRTNLTIRIDATRERAERVLEEVAAVAFGGGTVIFPTDTVYGIGCDPMQLQSVERIFVAKGRPRDKPLSLHLPSVAELLEYIPNDARAQRLARRFLPGPLTLVTARPRWVDQRVSGGAPSIGMRVPDHALCLALLERCGPLAATSANRSGAAAYTGEGEAACLPEADLFVDAGPTPLRAESTIIDLTGERARLIREGAVRVDMIEQQIQLHLFLGEPS